jgi:hypothetical protein
MAYLVTCNNVMTSKGRAVKDDIIDLCKDEVTEINDLGKGRLRQTKDAATVFNAEK